MVSMPSTSRIGVDLRDLLWRDLGCGCAGAGAVVEGVRRLFFSKETGENLKARGTEGLKTATKNFKPLAPPEGRDAVQQGGLYVFKGRRTLLAHKDKATADHAKPEEVLAAAACGCK
eukprot:603718-Prorocentrum_minimum.AAC.3